MAFHGFVRATQDLDLWIREDEENISKLMGFVVDPMKYLKAVSQFDFDACYERSYEGQFKGINFRVINPHDLLKEKESTNRPKDQGDIEFLRRILK